MWGKSKTKSSCCCESGHDAYETIQNMDEFLKGTEPDTIINGMAYTFRQRPRIKLEGVCRKCNVLVRREIDLSGLTHEGTLIYSLLREIGKLKSKRKKP